MIASDLDQMGLVQERAALLEREQAALRKAEAALRSSDEFIAMLSHELRNPLSPIAAAGALLQRPDVTPEVTSQAATIIRRQTAHFTRLIDDLLDVARISVGRMTLHREPVDLAEAVSNAFQVPQRDAAQCGRRWSAVSTRLGRAGPANQIITNLMQCAEYRRRRHHPRVHAEDAGWGVLKIEDTEAASHLRAAADLRLVRARRAIRVRTAGSGSVSRSCAGWSSCTRVPSRRAARERDAAARSWSACRSLPRRR